MQRRASTVDHRSSVDDGADESRPLLPGTEWLVRSLHRPLRTMWRHGFRFLFLLDAVGLFGSMVLINLVRFGTDWPTYSASFYIVGFLAATAIHLVINYFYGLYEREPRLGRRPWLPRAIVAMAIGVGIQLVTFVFLDRYLMPRLNLGVFLFVGAVVLVVNRHISRILARRRQGPPRVVLVGSFVDAELATRHIEATEREVEVVGHVTDPGRARRRARRGPRHRRSAARLVQPRRRLPGADDDARSRRRRLPPTGRRPRHAARTAGRAGDRRDAVRPAARAQLPVVQGAPQAAVRPHPARPHRAAHASRCSPCWRSTSGVRAGSPVLYHQARIGKDGEQFRVVKFRTMVVDAETRGPRLSTANDDRIVKGLRWLRETRLDELPQLWNVLRGEMSLVGPRPERPELTVDIERSVSGWVRRHQLPPGLTGLAQIHGRYATNPEYKIGYDLQYLVNWSPVLDLQILVRTVWVVLSRRL